MTLLHVVQVGCGPHPKGLGGAALLQAWPSLGLLPSAIAAAGAKVTVLQAARADETLERDGVAFRFVAEPWLGRRNWGGLRPARLARVAQSLKPDIIHVHGLHFAFHTRALCRLGVPVVVQDHAGDPGARLRRLHRYGLAKIKGAAFTAAAQADPFRRAGILPAEAKIFAIAESSSTFCPGDRAAARAATGLFGDPALLWVGRLNHNKDPHTILNAVARLAAERPQVHLWMCFHEAPLLNAVRAQIASDSALAARVHLLGEVPPARIELLCRAADLFVLGSQREGSGYALLEAMACGLPAVVSDIPSFRQLTGDGHVGALVQCGDAAGFAAAIADLAARPASALRAAVQAHFEAELSFAAIASQWMQAYRLLVGKSSA